MSGENKRLENKNVFLLEKHKADLMSICSGRQKQQVSLALAKDLLLRLEYKREVEESSGMYVHSLRLCVRALPQVSKA